MNGFHLKITGLMITLQVQENSSLCHCHFLYLVPFSEENNETTSQIRQAEVLNLAGAVFRPSPCESPLLPGARPAAAMASGQLSAQPWTWRPPSPSAVSSRRSGPERPRAGGLENGAGRARHPAASQVPLRASLSAGVLSPTPGAAGAAPVPPGALCRTILLRAARAGTTPPCTKQQEGGGPCPEPVTRGLCTKPPRTKSDQHRGGHGPAPRRTGVWRLRGEVRAPSSLSRGWHRAPNLCSRERRDAGDEP